MRQKMFSGNFPPGKIIDADMRNRVKRAIGVEHYHFPPIGAICLNQFNRSAIHLKIGIGDKTAVAPAAGFEDKIAIARKIRAEEKGYRKSVIPRGIGNPHYKIGDQAVAETGQKYADHRIAPPFQEFRITIRAIIHLPGSGKDQFPGCRRNFDRTIRLRIQNARHDRNGKSGSRCDFRQFHHEKSRLSRGKKQTFSF